MKNIFSIGSKNKMKIKNKTFIYDKIMDYAKLIFIIGLISYIFIGQAFNTDARTESYTHLIGVLIMGLFMIQSGRDMFKGYDELEKKIHIEAKVKTYSTIMPILFCLGYGILKFAKLHYEAQIVGLTFACFFIVEFIVRYFINKKYE